MIRDHRSSNEAFAVRQAEEEVNAIENDLRGGLSLMLTQMTGDDRFGKIAEALMPGGDHKALPAGEVVDAEVVDFPENGALTIQENTALQESGPSYMPVPAGAPAPLKIPEIPIESMTSDDLGRAISRILRKMERDPVINPVSERHGTKPLFARMVFNMTRWIAAGNCALFEIPELDDDFFCSLQLLTIAEDEGEQDRKPIRPFLEWDILTVHPRGAILVKDEFRSKVSASRLCPVVNVVIMKNARPDNLLMCVDHYIIVSSDGSIHVKKNRAGRTTTKPIPWEEFQERRYHVNDLLGRK